MQTSKTTKGIIAVAIVAALGYLAYTFTKKDNKKLNNKLHYAKIISSYTGTGYMLYMTLDEGYLKERAAAFKAGDATFTFNGKTYTTETGKVKI